MKKYISFIIAAFALTGLNSCLNDDSVFEDNGSKGIVELTLPARTTSTPYSVTTTTIEVKDEVELPIVVNYTGINGAPADVQITLAIDDAAVSKYDATGSTLPLPAKNYELPSSNVVTILKGQKTATYTIKLKPKFFDLTKSYALGVKIASTTAGTVSGNYSTGIYSLPVKSPWEGKYKVTINWDFSGSTLGSYAQYYPETIEAQLKTQGPGVVRGTSVGDLFGSSTDYKFNADGTIGFSTTSANIKSITVLESHYDINNLTFYHKTSFKHPTYGDFVLEETFTRIGDLE